MSNDSAASTTVTRSGAGDGEGEGAGAAAGGKGNGDDDVVEGAGPGGKAAAAAAAAAAGDEGALLLEEAGITAKECKNIFTELRKGANHPLMLLNHFKGGGKLEQVVDVLLRAEYFGAQATKDMVSERASARPGGAAGRRIIPKDFF